MVDQTSNSPVRFGGSFAPPIDEAKLARYRALADGVGDPMIGGYMHDLCNMVERFRETPASSLSGKPHPSGRGTIVPLESDEVRRIDDVVPWSRECDVMGEAFDRLNPVRDKETRNAAFHLLWYARELTQDREPITTDRLEA